jgi:hypothetical protein
VIVSLARLYQCKMTLACAPRPHTLLGKETHLSTVPHALPSRDRPSHSAGSLHTLCP